MTAKPLTKAHLNNTITKASKFGVTELPFDLKDDAKAVRIQALAKDLQSRMKKTSLAVVVLELPKDSPAC